MNDTTRTAGDIAESIADEVLGKIRTTCVRALPPVSTWTAPTSWAVRHYPGGEGDLIATHDEATALCWLGWRDGEPRVTLGVLDDDGVVVALSDAAEQWDAIERVIPRESWPREMFAGKRVPEHDAPADLRALLDAAIAEYRADWQVVGG